MGVLTMELEKINKTVENNQKEVEKLSEKIEIDRNQKQNQREYEAGLKKAVENDLITTFMSTFEREGLERGFINLSLKSTRDDVLKHVPESDFEYNYANLNYERILNKVKKIYENDQKAKEQLLILQLQQEEEQKRIEEEEKKKTVGYKIFVTLATVAIVLFFIIKWSIILAIGFGIFLFFFVSSLAKEK